MLAVLGHLVPADSVPAVVAGFPAHFLLAWAVVAAVLSFAVPAAPARVSSVESPASASLVAVASAARLRAVVALS